MYDSLKRICPSLVRGPFSVCVHGMDNEEIERAAHSPFSIS